jgi:hypothetical protein
MYKLQREGVLRLADSTWIPLEPANRDYQEFKAWCSKGNKPEPYVTDAELAAVTLAENLMYEVRWAAQEQGFVAEQLLRIEDNDPTALPGTAEQWRSYRVALRAHTSPNTSDRPSRPE